MVWRSAKSPRARPGHADTIAGVLLRLGASAALPPGPPLARPYLYQPALAGREQALEALERTLSRAESGEGAWILIEGESGTGKTRLAMELLRRARARRLRTLSSECLAPVATAPAAPLDPHGTDSPAGRLPRFADR